MRSSDLGKVMLAKQPPPRKQYVPTYFMGRQGSRIYFLCYSLTETALQTTLRLN